MSPLMLLFRLAIRRLLHRHVGNSSSRGRPRPIPVWSWQCACTQVWADEEVSAVCQVCAARFDRVSPITKA
jgi:hypothetical protein